METNDRDPLLQAEQLSIEVSRKQALRTLGKVGLGGIALSAGLQARGAGALAAGRQAARGDAQAQRELRFVFVNHVTTNPFFTATQYGAADACRMLGCSYEWTGSENSVVIEMVHSIRAAVAKGADGIAVAIIDSFAFDDPVLMALERGIPVVSYNADSATNPRMAYIGQDLYLSGQGMGKRIVRSVPERGHVALFIATPGSLNIQPRIDGAIDVIRQSGRNISYDVVATGALVDHELATIDAYYRSHRNVQGLFAVDAGSTASIATVSRRYGLQKRGVATGGFDLLPQTVDAIRTGDMAFTIDQQPYLQGFYPVLQLFLYKQSNTLMFPSDTDTGLKFVTRATLQPYLSTSRYEGTSH